MKKVGMVLLALLLTLSTLAGCTAATADSQIETSPAPTLSPEQEALPENEDGGAAALEEEQGSPVSESGILMSVKPKTVTTEMEQVTVIVVNQTDKDYSMDYVQKLEQLTDGEWKEVPLTTEAASLALLVVPAGEMMEFTFDFAYHYDKLERGTYRIVKTFVDKDGGNIEAFCQFEMF